MAWRNRRAAALDQRLLPWLASIATGATRWPWRALEAAGDQTGAATKLNTRWASNVDAQRPADRLLPALTAMSSRPAGLADEATGVLGCQVLAFAKRPAMNAAIHKIVSNPDLMNIRGVTTMSSKTSPACQASAARSLRQTALVPHTLRAPVIRTRSWPGGIPTISIPAKTRLPAAAMKHSTGGSDHGR